MDALVSEEALIASNTSSVSITKLASSISHPEQVVGLHFFNPVPVMSLVEIVRGLETSDATTISLVGLPPGEFRMPIFDVVMNRITIRGSIVGGREDLAEAIAFAAEGKVKAEIHRTKLDTINQVFSDLKAGKIDGRAVLMI